MKNDNAAVSVEVVRGMLDKGLDAFEPIIEHAKEAKRNFMENPTPENKVMMELAKQNVFHVVKGLVERILWWAIFQQHNTTEDKQ